MGRDSRYSIHIFVMNQTEPSVDVQLDLIGITMFLVLL